MRKASLEPSDLEHSNDTNALRLSQILEQAILTQLQKKILWTKINPHSYKVNCIYPRKLNPDIQWLSWKAQVEYNAANHYIELEKDYYDLEEKLWNTPEWKGLWEKMLYRLQHPSQKNRRWQAKNAIAHVAQKVAITLSGRLPKKSAN